MNFTSPNDLVGYHMIMSVSRLQPIWLNITENLASPFTSKLTLLNAFLNGHRFCTSNGTVPFEVATNRMDYNALPAGCHIIYCRPLLLELTSSEPLTLDEEVRMQEEWHRDEKKCTLVILARDLLLLDLDIVEDDRPSVTVASPSRIPSP
jgi:hypothetical protein